MSSDINNGVDVLSFTAANAGTHGFKLAVLMLIIAIAYLSGDFIGKFIKKIRSKLFA